MAYSRTSAGVIARISGCTIWPTFWRRVSVFSAASTRASRAASRCGWRAGQACRFTQRRRRAIGNHKQVEDRFALVVHDPRPWAIKKQLLDRATKVE